MYYEEITASPDEAEALAALSDALSRSSSALIGADGRRYPISRALRQVLSVACEALARGQSVAVVPRGRDLTTDEAAAFLGVPAARVLRLLERGELPAHGDRRNFLADLVRFQERHDHALYGAITALRAARPQP